MAYTWTNGEVITAEKLNNTGSGVGEFVINITGAYDETEEIIICTADKTYSEVLDAYNNGRHISVYYSGDCFEYYYFDDVTGNEVPYIIQRTCCLNMIDVGTEDDLVFDFSSGTLIDSTSDNDIYALYIIDITISEDLIEYNSGLAFRFQPYIPNA